MCKGTKHKYHLVHAQRKEAQSLEESGPKQVENKPVTKPNQLNFVPNTHGPSPEDHRRPPNKHGHNWAQPWCGRTTTWSIQRHPSWATSYHLTYVGCCGLVQIQRIWRSVWWYYERIMEYSMHIHSPLHYKRRPPPSYITTTHMEQEQFS